MLIAIIKIKKIFRIEKDRDCPTFSTKPRVPRLNTEAPTSYSEESANGAFSKKDKFR